MIAFLRNLLSRRRPVDDRVVIDLTSYYDHMEANSRRIRALELAIEKEHERIALIVGSWARDTVSRRDRAAIPRSAGRDAAKWLPGLGAQEIINLSQSSALAIRHHMFGDERIPGVRKVQPLPECVLIWPRPRLVEDARDDRGSGGGPRVKSRRLG